jgi:hypothetical protein
MSRGLKLENVIFTGRTYSEYVRMFNLKEEVLSAYTFFVCPGGASSFTSVANKKNYKVRTGDVLYGLSKEELEERGRSSVNIIRSKMGDVINGYNWDEYGDVEGLLNERVLSLKEFLSDYESGLEEGRYLKCTLPVLPLADNEVDIVLSDHLLFTYPQFFDYNFHLQSIKEMLRIAKSEVRLFPLISSGSGTRPQFFEKLNDHLNNKMGFKTTIETVPYHFQIGSNKILRIQKSNSK